MVDSMDEQLVFESCHSTWLFDTERMRFCRILKEGTGRVATPWRAYHSLIAEPGSEVFTVVLNAEGTRMLRSWRHTEACSQCGGRATAELRLDEVRPTADRSTVTAPG